MQWNARSRVKTMKSLFRPYQSLQTYRGVNTTIFSLSGGKFKQIHNHCDCCRRGPSLPPDLPHHLKSGRRPSAGCYAGVSFYTIFGGDACISTRGRWFSISVQGRVISFPSESSNGADTDPLPLQPSSSCRDTIGPGHRHIYHIQPQILRSYGTQAAITFVWLVNI